MVRLQPTYPPSRDHIQTCVAEARRKKKKEEIRDVEEEFN